MNLKHDNARNIVVRLELIRATLLAMPPARELLPSSGLLFSSRLGCNAQLACGRPGWSARSRARKEASGLQQAPCKNLRD